MMHEEEKAIGCLTHPPTYLLLVGLDEVDDADEEEEEDGD